jgi:hypothetical protein
LSYQDVIIAAKKGLNHLPGWTRWFANSEAAKTPDEPWKQRAELIKQYSSRHSFADIGCMWGINGEYSFLAEQSGATSVTAVDVFEPTPEFLQTHANRNSSVRYVNADINAPDLVEKVGVSDVVFCSGVFYHVPNPLHMLYQLRTICRQTLILGTEIIPEMPGIENGAVFYPYLSDEQRQLWHRGIGLQMGISEPYKPQDGYGNWFWGMTPSCICSMLKVSGFSVREVRLGTFFGLFVCQAEEIKFAPVAGAYVKLHDEQFTQHQQKPD